MNYRVPYCALLTLAVASAPAFAQLTVTLTPNISSPQMVGTPIVFTAVASGGSGNYDYQFSANLTSTPTQIKQDFNGLMSQFTWVPSVKEGNYTIGVVARDLANKSSRAFMTAPYTVTPALNAGAQAIHTTANTLVALFSAPPCPAGQRERVVFLKAHQTAIKFNTNPQPCDNVTSMNYYVAGMYPNTAYNMFWETLDSLGNKIATGAPMQFLTGAIPTNISLPSPIFVAADSPNQVDPDQAFPIILQGFTPGFGTAYNVAATDLAGNYLWYAPPVLDLISRTEVGGKLFAIQTPTITQSNPQPYAQQLLEIDLVGNQLLNTNAEIVSEQLAAHGKHPITSFSHEVRRLPGGDILLIGAEERLIANANQCGSTNGVPNTCDVLGDEIIVLNSNMQYLWSWDGFDNGTYTDSTGSHQLVDDKAVLGETCAPNGGGCPAFYLAPVANDWTHSNSTTLTADGNIILSIRHLDWVIKVNYGNGSGDAHIMWRMGNNGDFALTTIGTTGTDFTMDLATFPWFSHQHDAQFAFNDEIIDGVQIFAAYDDGNTRIANVDPNGHSRGQVYAVNEPALQANLNVNTDLQVYSFALGVAQVMANGNYFFDSGIVAPTRSSPSVVQEAETDALGNLLYILQVCNGTSSSHALAYRAFRMPNLYFETP